MSLPRHCVQEMSLHVLRVSSRIFLDPENYENDENNENILYYLHVSRVSSRIFYLHPENFENNENNENLLLGVAMIGIGSWLWR